MYSLEKIINETRQERIEEQAYKDRIAQENKPFYDRLEKIIQNNKTRIEFDGFDGFLQILSNQASPEYHKAQAAKHLISHRKCVVSNRDYFKRKWRGSFWLDKAAHSRRLALRLSRETPAASSVIDDPNRVIN